MDRGRLTEVFEAARERGFLGPGPVVAHVEHAVTLAELIGGSPGRFLDLGSGGGVPGLVLAQHWADTEAVLVDAGERRCEFLEDAVGILDLARRVIVRCGRAEALARDPALRAEFPLVVARGFGAPAVVAECGVGFLAAQGRLVVTEPPPAADGGADQAGAESSLDVRWPPTALAELGFGPPMALRQGNVGAVALQALGSPADRWPRRTGIPTKRPLW